MSQECLQVGRCGRAAQPRVARPHPASRHITRRKVGQVLEESDKGLVFPHDGGERSRSCALGYRLAGELDRVAQGPAINPTGQQIEQCGLWSGLNGDTSECGSQDERTSVTPFSYLLGGVRCGFFPLYRLLVYVQPYF